MTILSNLESLFKRNINKISEYIKPGQKFWTYVDSEQIFKLFTVTYIRSGVVFYKFENETKEEHFSLDSMFCQFIYPETIDTDKIADICGYDKSIFNSNLNFDDIDGKIKITVI